MNYSNLMEVVNARIRANGKREITGDTLNDVLRAMVVELGAGYQLGGTIRPGDKPKDEDLRVAYLAVEPGMYLYAGGFEVTELSLITYGAEWYMYPLGVPFGTQIADDIAAAVEAEKTRAMAAEKVLSDAIATERGERAAADSALDSAIKAETKRATDAEGVLAKAVEDEKARAQAAEGANAAAIASEADAREQADTTLQGNITAEKTAREAADKALGTRVASIEDKIPAQATAENKLADKDFVNSSIATSTATFRGTFETLEALKAAQADKNDYAFWVHKDEDGNTCYDKYTYTGTEWLFEYRLNNSSFTAAQWAALNSGVTADVIKALQDADKANVKAIADEKAAREQADTTLQGNIDKKQDTISDLATIRTQAAHGQTAFGWGDHAKAGYIKPFVINVAKNESTQELEIVDAPSTEDVRYALNANNLILLKTEFGKCFPLTYANDDGLDIYLQFFTIYGDGDEHYDYLLTFYGQGTPTVDYFDYRFATDDDVTREADERKAADQALQANIDKKQDTISDLATIRTNAANGQTAFGWGDHAKAGYIKAFIINITGDGSAENPYAVNKTYAEVLNAINANMLILLKETHDGYGYIYSLTYAADFQQGGLILQFFTIYGDGDEHYEYILQFSPDDSVSIDYFNYRYATENDIQGLESVTLYYNGLGGNNEPIFVNDTGTALTRVQICALLNGVEANRVVLNNKASSVMQTSSVKFLQNNANEFMIGFEGANASGQIFDILYKWDATGAKVLRAELLYNPMA